jgi:stage V sporulation protein B
LNYVLIGVPQINLKGAVVGTGAFYLVCIIYNYVVLRKETGFKIDVKSVIFKPLVSAVLCGGAAYGSFRVLSEFIVFNEGSRLSGQSICCLLSIGVAVVVYAIAVLLLKTLVKNDILMLPKGEKIAEILEKYKLIV